MDLISDDEGTAPITINKKYAEKFEREARFKELQRGAELGLLDGDDDEDDSSDEEEEDDDAEALSQLLDAKIIHTINSIRKKDPKIYDKSTMWFEKNDEDDDEKETASTAKKEKKMRYKDVVREQMLGGNAVGEEEGMEEEEEVGGSSRKTKQFAYDAEQDKIRLQLIQSIHSKDKSHSNDSGDEESGDDILKPVQKTSKEKQEEDEELQRELEELKRLGKCGLSNPESDDFLFDYISKQKWKVPVEASANKDDVDDDEDEEEIDQSDRFESSYNFRFEEVDALKENVSGGGMFSSMGQVVGHARSVDDSVRRKDTKRKDAREKRMEKKEKEKRQKEAELRRLKNLKRLEVLTLLNPLSCDFCI